MKYDKAYELCWRQHSVLAYIEDSAEDEYIKSKIFFLIIINYNLKPYFFHLFFNSIFFSFRLPVCCLGSCPFFVGEFGNQTYWIGINCQKDRWLMTNSELAFHTNWIHRQAKGCPLNEKAVYETDYPGGWNITDKNSSHYYACKHKSQ